MVGVSLIANHELQALYKKMKELERERDVLRERLEAAEKVIDLAEDTIPAGLNTHGVCVGLPVAVRQYRERFGGRADDK